MLLLVFEVAFRPKDRLAAAMRPDLARQLPHQWMSQNLSKTDGPSRRHILPEHYKLPPHKGNRHPAALVGDARPVPGGAPPRLARGPRVQDLVLPLGELPLEDVRRDGVDVDMPRVHPPLPDHKPPFPAGESELERAEMRDVDEALEALDVVPSVIEVADAVDPVAVGAGVDADVQVEHGVSEEASEAVVVGVAGVSPVLREGAEDRYCPFEVEEVAEALARC